MSTQGSVSPLCWTHKATGEGPARPLGTSHDCGPEGSPHATPLGAAVPIWCPAEPAPTPSSATRSVLHEVTHAVVSIICQSLSYHFETHLSDTQHPPPSPESPPIPPGAEKVCQCAHTNYFPAETGQHSRKNS